MKYRHKNNSAGYISVNDGKGNFTLLKPGEEIVLPVKRAGCGVIIVEEIPEEKKKKKIKEDN